MMAPSNIFVTGGAGFIGSSLADRLLAVGHAVTVFDNLSTGRAEFLEGALRQASFRFIQGDLLDETALGAAMEGADFVFHLAANADVRFGPDNPRRDLEQNTIATFNVLEAMRRRGVRRLAFSSTGSVYGEATVIPTPEDAAFPVQTSFYGASKSACEGLIAAYCESFGFQAFVFRFVSILGERYTHGHVFDFYRMLLEDPSRLTILGDGAQRKSYLYVQDCIDAMLLAIDRMDHPINILNLGAQEHVAVDDSVGIIIRHLGVNPTLTHSGGKRGWVGDNPFIFLDGSRMRSLGWAPAVTIPQGIVRTLEWLKANRWVYERQA